MIELRSIPLLRITISFILGIVVGRFLELSNVAIVTLVSVLFVSAVIASYNKNPKLKWLVGSLLNLLIFSIGWLSIHFSNSTKRDNHFTKFISEGNYYTELTVTELGNIDSVKTKCIANVNVIKLEDKSIETFGKCAITFSAPKAISLGDKLICKARFSTNKQLIENPGSFDYWGYLANKDVYAQAYCYSNNWRLITHDNVFSFRNKAQQIRQRLINLLSIYLSGDELSVALALIIGYDDLISKDVYTAFANTGTLHVLSVSGMHVGLVYGVVLWLLSFVKDINRRRLLELVIALPILWFYAFITGLSPSVMRAALMLSFIVVGNSLRQKPSIYNSLCGSALLMLIVSPTLLFNVSFQLSYLAVIGISFFYKRIHNLWYLENTYLDKVWGLTAASVAAQVTTLPISIYYFNQFPNYFLINNMLVIPLSTIIIYMGIALICFSPISAVAVYLSKLTSILLIAQNSAVDYLSRLPFANSSNLYLTTIEVLLLYLVLLLLMIFLVTRKFNLLKPILIATLMFSILHFATSLNYRKQSSFIVYQNKSTSIGFVDDGKLLMMSSKSNNQLIQSTKKHYHLNALISSNLNSEFSQPVNNVFIHKSNYEFKGKHIVYLNDEKSLNQNEPQLNLCDVIIVDGKVFPNDEIVLNSKSTLVITQNTGYKTTEKWKEIASVKHCQIHLIRDQGAFVLQM